MWQNLQRIFHFLQHDRLLNLYFDVMEGDHHQYLHCNENPAEIGNGIKRNSLTCHLDSFQLIKALAKDPGAEAGFPLV